MSRVFLYATGRYLLLAALLSGCAEESGPTLVEGQVVDSQTQQPVAHATVQVEQASRGGGFGSGGYAPVGTSYPTDAQGRFRFRFETEDASDYIVRASTPLGHFTDWLKAPSLKGGRQNQGLQVPVLAPAWIKVQLVDEPPKSRVRIFFSGFGGGGYTLNFPRDTSVVFPYYNTTEGFIYWRITPDLSPEVTGQHILPLIPLDTVTVRIPF
ncbi:carboxypeptidase-like regulatory domain-containing protein [Hymenobacter profundi]|uniref:Carboxypeptidase-like regulatory domain-containing protein n=1 Tax=Hymenobacter profundi TaxID=1982110 RepID=A0ABS6WX56_9BACT|nr:carboxypeptidase-like regulatory domain-containing protein [Hymenobacter profundi]MBW3127363.1 carboxypeptidase-like regulatory domain-containing protein [Hymenobacter profundi]